MLFGAPIAALGGAMLYVVPGDNAAANRTWYVTCRAVQLLFSSAYPPHAM